MAEPSLDLDVSGFDLGVFGPQGSPQAFEVRSECLRLVASRLGRVHSWLGHCDRPGIPKSRRHARVVPVQRRLVLE